MTPIVKDVLRLMDKVTSKNVLASLGLRQAKRSRLADLGLFAAGVCVGAGVSLLMAPQAGRDLRATLQSQIDKSIGLLKKGANMKDVDACAQIMRRPV